MTDNEIIKALEYCKNCSANLNIEIIDLITHQQAEYNNLLEQFRILDCECGRLEKADENQKAEIERLKIENQLLRSAANSCKLHYNEARVEAVKEFVENVTYCKYCKNYELMTSNNQHFCNRYGGYVKETDCCSRGYTL